jgi:hypothetical protein
MVVESVAQSPHGVVVLIAYADALVRKRIRLTFPSGMPDRPGEVFFAQALPPEAVT